MDSIGSHIQRTQIGFNSNIHPHIIYVFHTSEKKGQLKMLCKPYLSVIFMNKEGNTAILSDNRTELNTVLNEACEQLAIKRFFSNPFHPKGNSRIKNLHNFNKRTLIKFLETSDLEWDELLPFVCYCYDIFLGSNGTEPPHFLLFGHKPAGDCLTYLNNCSKYYRDDKGRII